MTKKCSTCIFFQTLFTRKGVPFGKACTLKFRMLTDGKIFSEPEALCDNWQKGCDGGCEK